MRGKRTNRRRQLSEEQADENSQVRRENGRTIAASLPVVFFVRHAIHHEVPTLRELLDDQVSRIDEAPGARKKKEREIERACLAIKTKSPRHGAQYPPVSLLGLRIKPATRTLRVRDAT